MTLKVLCIDDDPDITCVLQEGFGSQGFTVFTASNVLEALEIIRKTTLDVIVLDLLLPDVDGFGFCELLANERRNRNVPVIVASGYASDETRNVALNHGAVAFVPKPFELLELVAVAKRVIAERRSETAREAV
jgi:DNA-binding response OmpR family regulator